MLALYAPARPRSLETTRTAIRSGVGRAVTSGWSIVVWLATAVTARVIASAYGLEELTRCCALAMRDVAISSNVRVIFLVDCADLMRWRRTRIWAAIGQDALPAPGRCAPLRAPSAGGRCRRIFSWPSVSIGSACLLYTSPS